MSVCKLLSRIVTPDTVDYETMEVKKAAEEDLHSYTYGITSDPIAQFACTLAALIHDTDHSGVPNVQLCKENVELAEYYKSKRNKIKDKKKNRNQQWQQQMPALAT